MIKKIILHGIWLSILILLPFKVEAQQTILLFTETFENQNSIFTLNTNGIGSNTGSNKWLINNEFDGQNIVPNTTNQDSTTSGTIANSPFSTYLHISDSATSIANANFNPNNPSDRFVESSGFCTLGFFDVTLDFFYLAEGDSTNFGEMYFSANGSAWQKTGQAKYFGQKKWKFERVTNPAFDNINDLRIGFRWQNNGNGATPSLPFAIDDIIAVGTFDPISNPINISVAQIFPNPVCRLNTLVLQYELSAPLCAGTYGIELSNGQGNFSGALSLGVFNIGNLDTTGFISVQIPGNIPLSACYRIRVNRISPLPQITGAASICFAVENCPNVINTQAAVVTTDPDTVCARSAIDVQFTSTGIYVGQNRYIAELSDSAGNFTNPLFIGELPSTETFDPSIGAMPGNVSGLIPSVPEGCNYFIRVRSTQPAALGSIFGPFCIKQCDIETNLTLDIQICIMENEGQTDTVEVITNFWNNNANYFPGNQFIVQLLDRMTLAIINEGALGIVVDTNSTNLILTVPGLNQLVALGIAPGNYYMRIIADSSSTPNNSNGTIIRLTIGAPSDNAATIIVNDTVQCNTNIVTLTVDPWNPESEYLWFSNGFNPNPVSIQNSPSILVNFNGAQPDDFSFFVREVNFGCPGPFSATTTLFIISSPLVDITGPSNVCLGDTVQFVVPFLVETFYDWRISNGTIIDTSNNELTVVFDQTGNVNISLDAINKCGSQSNNIQIEVVQPISLSITPDTSVCQGTPIEVSVSVPDGIQRSINAPMNGTVTRNGTMFMLTAQEALTLNSFEVHLGAGNNFNFEIYYLQGNFSGFESNLNAWTSLGSAFNVVSNGVGNTTPIPINVNFMMNQNDTFSFYITTTNNTNLRLSIGNSTGALYANDGILALHEGTANQFLFGAFLTPRIFNGKINYTTFSGLDYAWSNGATTSTIKLSPTISTSLSVTVSDSLGCNNSASTTIGILPLPSLFAGTDTIICLGGSVNIAAQAAGSFSWTPLTGIENPDALNTIFKPEQTTLYILSVIDSFTGCEAKDSLFIIVSEDEGNLDTVQFCINTLQELSLPASANGEFLWSTGATTQSITVGTTDVFIGEYLKDSNGCIGKVAFDAQVIDCDKIIQPAQAFSPNNDNINDRFTIFGKNILSFEIRIYNRWGEEVYQSNDISEINDKAKGWDGTHKGKLQNNGVYVYFIKATDRNNIKVELKGNLTLIR